MRPTSTLQRILRKPYQEFVFWRGMRRLLRDAELDEQPFWTDTLADLVYGWGNNWSAQTEYLEACLREVRETKGPVLECGSGLSTLLIGAVAQRERVSVWSLEHDIGYASRVQGYLDRYGVRNVRLCIAPIKSYGDFDWYTPPSFESIAGKFSLVICDGPPGTTRGGRYGLVPVMRDKLAHDCTILLDDGKRPEERAIASRWARMLGASQEVLGTEKPYIHLKAGQIPPVPAH